VAEDETALSWQVEHGLPVVQGLGAGECIRAYVQCAIRGARHGNGDDRLHNREGSPSRAGLKSGTVRQATGKSKGRWTTKILALTDALGNLVRFLLMPGNRNDTVGAVPLIKGSRFDALLSDKAFDSNWIIEDMNARGALICISQRPQRPAPLEIDMELHKSRHLIWSLFCKLKDFKRIALRAEKTGTSFEALICAVAALINSK
jgi:transposase